ENCADGLDNDGDSLIDCADPDCVGKTGPGGCLCAAAEICNDGCDNDGDGLTDCADPDCAGQAGTCGTCQATETSCSDGCDNDGDGKTDCAGPDCANVTCDDGNACTVQDHCSSGSCVGTPSLTCGKCAHTMGYWKNHASAWPVSSLTIGGITYSKAQALKILNDSNSQDPTKMLAAQLIAAK